MALVILPCDMPWWGVLQNHIKKLARAQKADELINGMQTIYTMCNVGLDPDEPDVPDATVLNGLRQFLLDELTDLQQEHFFSTTLATIVQAALDLRSTKPVTGLPFSLQQEEEHLYPKHEQMTGDCLTKALAKAKIFIIFVVLELVPNGKLDEYSLSFDCTSTPLWKVGEIEVSHEFACSLLAHAFLSSYPKRTNKTHPTLQDFNFSNFFPFLKQKFQKAKLHSIFHYFDVYGGRRKDVMKTIKISRQVMKGTEWLTIEDWLECTLPLCPLSIKHDSRMENTDQDESVFVCFSSKKPGGRVLSDGSSRECVQFVTSPELLVTLLCVEALEDNEVVIVENVIQVGKITNIRLKPDFEPRRTNLSTITVCLMDAENYTRLPLSQYEEDNVLRELNKALLGFRQKQQQRLTHNFRHQPVARRLSPIGESFSPTPTENGNCNIMKNQINRRKENMKQFGTHLPKGKFIVLGSSGELLPVSRNTAGLILSNSDYATCPSQDSSPEEFYSARTSLTDCDGSDEEVNARRYSVHLDTVENRNSFAERLREALNRAQSSSSSDSSYAVDISVAGSSIADPNIRMKRGGSRGFMLEEDSFDVNHRSASKSHSFEEDNRRNSLNNTSDECTRNKGGSSKYSFSTDYNSELEEVYDQLSRWLDESEDRQSSEESSQEQKLRDNVIIQFAGSLLKRTLSESFVGVPLSESADIVEEVPDESTFSRRENLKLKMAVRSLSLELAKHKHRLAAQLISVIGHRQYASSDGLAPVVTGNWGCGSQNLGDPQLKLLIQWLAASVSGLPNLIYYTCNHRKLLKLDTVCRVLVDRQWNVGELVRAVIFYMQFTIGQADNSVMYNDCDTLFDLLINSDEKITSIKKKIVK